MMIERSKEWWLARVRDEPDCPIGAGVPTERDALWACQQFAAIGIEETNDVGPLADLFAAIHRTAASALASPEPPRNEAAARQALALPSQDDELDQLIARFRSLLAKATPGPWAVEDRRNTRANRGGGSLQIQAQHRGAGSSYCVASVNFWEVPTANADLIVAAVNALPILLDRLQGRDDVGGEAK